MPSGLAPFPSGWQPYEPPPPAVVQRANALLPALWTGGPGTFKVEKTAGVWVYYRATQMGEKRGVVAFREKVPSQTTAQTERDARNIETAPVVMPAMVVTPGGSTVPASSSSTALPTLRRGSKGADVRILQQRLGITADGDFGPKTEAAVRAYQARNGLVADGVVGPKTWAALMAKAA
jgi:murein L,D-transpeptidase YcbB/YkuD